MKKRLKTICMRCTHSQKSKHTHTHSHWMIYQLVYSSLRHQQKRNARYFFFKRRKNPRCISIEFHVFFMQKMSYKMYTNSRFKCQTAFHAILWDQCHKLNCKAKRFYVFWYFRCNFHNGQSTNQPTGQQKQQQNESI